MTKQTQEYYEALMMKTVDGRISALEQKELEAYLLERPEEQAALDDFLAIKASTDGLRQRILSHALIEPIRPTATIRRFDGVALLLLCLGALIFFAFGGYHLMADPKVPVLLKLGVGLMGIGVFALLARVLFFRVRGLQHDPYREIDQ